MGICKTSNHRCRKCKNTVCNFCGERDPSSDNEMHIMHKENDTRCKVGESEIERQRRLNRQKEYEHNRFTKTRERAKKVQEVREKRLAESEKEKERRLTQDKEYQSRKRSEESEKEKERRLNKQKEYDHKKRSEESEIEKERRLTQDKEYQRQKRRQPIKDWEQQLIDKASLTHICTSPCRYRPKASMVVVTEKMFNSEQMELLTINNETKSIDGKHYVCKYCKRSTNM